MEPESRESLDLRGSPQTAMVGYLGRAAPESRTRRLIAWSLLILGWLQLLFSLLLGFTVVAIYSILDDFGDFIGVRGLVAHLKWFWQREPETYLLFAGCVFFSLLGSAFIVLSKKARRRNEVVNT